MDDGKRVGNMPQRLVFGLALFWVLLSGSVQANAFQQSLVAAALERTEHQVTYNGGYYRLDYPNGDVPANIGVCTDVIIRAYRAVGTDLQVKVHEDMTANFSAYPSKRIWGLNSTDRNIDHRRVPNLQAFFTRHGTSLPVSQTPSDYHPGDLVTWIAR